MSTAKGNEYLQLLDRARCNGQWDQIPELCRKVRKHAGGRKCLALTAETEARLRHLPPPPPTSTSSTKESYVAQLNSLQGALQKEIDSYDVPLPEIAAPAGGGHVNVVTHEDLIQARTVVSWISSLKEEWGTVLRTIPSEGEVGESFGAGVEQNDYIQIIRIKALVLKGIALSHETPDRSLPFQLYRVAIKLPETYTKTQRTYPTFLQWTEKAMAYHAMASYQCWLETNGLGSSARSDAQARAGRHDAVGVAVGQTPIDTATVIGAFKSFHNYVNALASGGRDVGTTIPSVPGDSLSQEKDVERRQLYHSYFKFLSLLLLPPGHPDFPGNSNSVDGHGAGTPEELRRELKTAQEEYEKYMLRGLSFPQADQYHEEVGEWVDQVFENWRAVGGSAEEALPVVEILYRAAQKTFHSPRILRYLFQTLTATGNFQDAIAALETYVELVEKAKERIAKGHAEKDFDSDKVIFHTVVEGIRVLCKFTKLSDKAMSMAEKIEEWAVEWSIRDSYILAEIHRGVGMANAAWSRLTPDGDARPPAQTAAMKAFKKSLSFNPSDIQSWYGLALLELETGQTDSGMESARRGLGALKHVYLDHTEEVSDEEARDYKRSAVSLLHLLALSMTAKEDFENADRVCKNAFEIIGEGREAVSEFGVVDKLSVLELMMTHLAIAEAVEDTENALPMAEKLLELYSTLFDGTHLIQLQRADADVSPDQIASSGVQSSRPPTTASRKSRFLSLRGKKQFSASFSHLPQDPVPQDTAPSRSNTLKKRPKSGHQPGGQSNAPKIEVTAADTSNPAISEKSARRMSRPNSVSGGTIRRMRSLSSIRMKGPIPGEPEPPTPPLPSSTETSLLNFGHKHHGGKDPHLFHSLKNKLHRHHNLQVGGSPADGSTTTLESPADDQASGEPTGEPSAKEGLSGNMRQGRLPLPLGAVSRHLPEDNTKGGRSPAITRPRQLPEPKLAVSEERKQVLGGLRKVWLCVASLYRRAKFYEDCDRALEEAATLIDADGTGEADVLAEKGLLEMAQGDQEAAKESFELALTVDLDHPEATIGLSSILLRIDEDPEAENPAENEIDRLASRDRALALLEHLTTTLRGWDDPEAWFVYSQALEQAEEIERAKVALWKVIELEDGRGVRGWRSCGCGVL